MNLQLTGKVVQILNEQSGEGKNGPWKKRDFILEIPGKYPRKVCITQWGDSIDTQPVQEGSDVTVSIDIQSREYKGNWYTDVKAWKVEAGSSQQNAPELSSPGSEDFTVDTNEFDDLDDDLPF